MAGSIGTAYINIAPNMSGIQGKIASGLRGQGTAAGEQLGSEIGNGASTKMAAISGVIAGATAALVSKGLDVATQAIGNFINSASQIQSLRASFESLTGSVDATNKVMGTLYQFGKQTAFSNEAIQSAGRNFLAVGQNADQMQESLKLAGDIAGATGADLTQLVLPLSQAYARGTLQTQDFYQILNSGAGALRGTLQQVVANKTGITNLGDAMSQGKVTTDLLWEAMRMATAQGGFAFDGAIKQSMTFNGRMSNLKESITNVGLGLLGVNAATGEVDSNGTFAKFSNVVQGLVDYLSSSNFQAIMKSVSDGLTSAINSLAGGVAFIVQNKDIFLPIAVGIGSAVVALKLFNVTMAISKGVMAAYTATTIFFNTVQALMAQGLGVGRAAMLALNIAFGLNPIGLIVIAITALVAGLIYFFTQTKTGQAIFQQFGKILGDVWKGIQTGFGAVVNFFKSAFTTVTTALAAVGNFFQGIFNAIGSAVGAFLQFFSDHWRIIIVIVLGPLGLLIDFVTAYWGEITGAISTALQAIWSVISTVFNAIAGFFSAIWGGIVAIVTGYVNLVWSIISTVFNAVSGFMGAVFGPPINAIIGVFQRLAGIVGSIVGGIWNGITGAFNSVTSFLGGVGGTIMRLFAGAGGWLVDSGKNIINGLINGASSLLGKIGNMFLDIIPGWIKEPFKKALGIRSPSRVFAGFGDNITQGLINGVVSNASGVTDAVGVITNAALQPMNSAIDPSIGVTGAIASSGAGYGSNSTQTVTIGTVVLQTQDAAKEFFKQLNQDTINVGMGLTPNQGAA